MFYVAIMLLYLLYFISLVKKTELDASVWWLSLLLLRKREYIKYFYRMYFLILIASNQRTSLLPKILEQKER